MDRCSVLQGLVASSRVRVGFLVYFIQNDLAFSLFVLRLYFKLVLVRYTIIHG